MKRPRPRPEDYQRYADYLVARNRWVIEELLDLPRNDTLRSILLPLLGLGVLLLIVWMPL